MDYFSLPFAILYAILFGITMKWADLLDEHGVKWFKGSKILFGVLWGFFGVLLILFRNDVANVMFARVLSYLPRVSLDHVNHGIAGAMIIIAFAWKADFSPYLFLTFFLLFLIFGFIRNYYAKKIKKGFLFWLNDPAYYYIIFTLIYSIWVADYTVFLIFSVQQISYNFTKYYYRALKKPSKILSH